MSGHEEIRINLREGLSAILNEIVLAFSTILIYPAGLFLPDFTDVEKSNLDRSPIILLPGLLMNRAHLFFMALYLRKRGFESIHTLNLFPLIRGIRNSAEKVSRLIDRLKVSSPDKRVVLIGFSMGGVIARYYAEQLGGGRNISMVITIASPHRGTKLLPLQLSKWKEFPTPPEDSAMVPTIFVYSIFDNMVIPYKNSFIEGRGERVSLGIRGHLGTFFSLTLFATIEQILQRRC